MKITTFNPLIVTKDADSVIGLFESLGFEKRHTITVNDGKGDITSVRMKDANGNNVDVAKANVPQDMTLIRMNVDNFDEAYEMLISKGFRNSQGDKTVDSATNKSAMMISPSGFAFDLCQHIVEDKQESIFNMLEQVTGGAEEEVKEEEFVDLRPKPYIAENLCAWCGYCAEQCPTGAISNVGNGFEINLAFCVECGNCADECPCEAIVMP